MLSKAGPIIGLLGAEKQAAVSAALAWPERRFLFLSDQPVLDGWDLPNVEMALLRGQGLGTQGLSMLVPLCARWVTLSPSLHNNLGSFALRSVMPALGVRFGETVLAVHELAELRACDQPYQVKGNLWHRPDGTLSGTAAVLAGEEDPYGCGLVYQEQWQYDRHFLCIGRRNEGENMQLGVVRVFSEVCARDDTLGAGETVEHAEIAVLTSEMARHLDHVGFFTCNWLERGGDLRLSSFRPVPRGVFGTFLRAGIDLLAAEMQDSKVAPAGLRFTVEIHYASYRSLQA